MAGAIGSLGSKLKHVRTARLRRLLGLLADRDRHSGAVLANTLGVSRTTLLRDVASLSALGVQLEIARGHGYRLLHPVPRLLDPGRIADALSPEARTWVQRLDCAMVTDSTNEELLRRADAGDTHGHVLLSEFQTAGRGRLGRPWTSALGSGICLSVSRRFDRGLQSLMPLGLVIGVAVAECLERHCGKAMRLKWPNDILCAGGKVGGILVELRGCADGPAVAVIGIGINVAQAPEVPGQQFVPVALAEPEQVEVDRDLLAAALVDRVLARVDDFERNGFGAIAQDWNARDGLAGELVQLRDATSTLSGTCRGVDEQGNLVLEDAGSLRRFATGELTLRLH